METYINWLIKNLKYIGFFTAVYFFITIFYENRIFGNPPINKCPNYASPLDDNFLSYEQTECFIENGYYAYVFQIDVPLTILSIIIIPIAVYKIWSLITK